MPSAIIAATTTGNTELVAAQAGKRIRVTGLVFTCAAAALVKFRSANTDLTGQLSFAANGGVAREATAGGSPYLFRTAVGEALNINLSGAVAAPGVAGWLEYTVQ